jgi:hypothetical protein
MSAVSIDDAIELLTDQTHVGNRSKELLKVGFVEMRGGIILNELQVRGAESREAAHALVLEALAAIGGHDASHLKKRGGLRPGRTIAARQFVPVFRVPVDELRPAA